VITAILLKVLGAFPKPGIWHMSGLMFSLNGERKKIAKKLLQETYKALMDVNPEDSAMLVDAQRLCTNLIQLAQHQCKERRLRWTMHPDVKLSNFLVPTQAVLHHSNPLRLLELSAANLGGSRGAISGSGTGNGAGTRAGGTRGTGAGAGMGAGAAMGAMGGVGGGSYYHSDVMFIASMNELVDVASSKAKPKTITLRTCCGRSVKFLAKQEKDGDLRKVCGMWYVCMCVTQSYVIGDNNQYYA
jgi:hypothetical protein